MRMTFCWIHGLVAGLAALAIVALPLQGQEASTGKIHVSVFEDNDLDGVIDEGEQAAVGEVAQLYRVDDDGKRTLVETCKTDDSSQCVFEDLPFGRYVVVFALSTGVTVETLPLVLTEGQPEIFVRPTPRLPKDRMPRFSLLDLGLRNPANVIGDQVSRFAPNP